MADKPKRGFYFTDQLAQKLESPLDQSVYVNVQASFHPTLTSVLELPRDEYGWVAIPHARDHSFQTDRTRVLRGVRRFLKTVGHGDVTVDEYCENFSIDRYRRMRVRLGDGVVVLGRMTLEPEQALALREAVKSTSVLSRSRPTVRFDIING